MNTCLKVPTQFKFAARLSYGGTQAFDVWENSNYFQVEVGNDSFRRPELYNGSEAEFQRDIVGRRDCITRNLEAPSRELVAAFNRWRRESHQERLQRLLSQPERYGPIEADDPIRNNPPVVVPAHYGPAGWVRELTVEEAMADAGF